MTVHFSWRLRGGFFRGVILSKVFVDPRVSVFPEKRHYE